MRAFIGRLEVSSKTSLNPSIVTVHFEWPTANSEFDKKNGPALKSRQFASSPQFGELPISTRSENPYSLPSRPLFKGNRIQEFINRPGDANLARWAVPAKTPLRLNVIESFPYHDPNTRVDWFNSKVSVLNSSALPTSIVAVRAFARLRMPLGDVTLKFPDNSGDNSSVGGSGIILSHIWKPVSNVVINSAKLPTQVGALGSADLGVSVGIEADKYYEADDARGMHGWRKPFSWIVLQSGFPVVVDLELEDIHGRIFGGVVELSDLWIECS
ncbi:hypothetical protein BDR26DRAFT_57487 [Obelidium mucronatum]|nr:hypothetical protein BDR26DRAFT_57487 [Obelidium mucronatum]